MMESKTNMFGKTYNTVGSTDSNFLIKTKGDFKVLWGGKYIDIIKNGKLASAGSNILKTVPTSDDISGNGIFLIPLENEVWVSIDGTKINLTEKEETSYISFLVELKEITSDLKYLALTNAGLYYETLEEAKSSEIKAGIIFVEDLKKLYIIKNGELSEYVMGLELNENFEELYIGDLHIYTDNLGSPTLEAPLIKLIINGKECITVDDTIIKVNHSVSMKEGSIILSEGANESLGFRLYSTNGSSVLEIDDLIWRNQPDASDKNTELLLDPFTYSKNNIILSAELQALSEDLVDINCNLKYVNEYKKDLYVYIYLTEENTQYVILLSSLKEDSQPTLQANIINKVAPEEIILKVVYDNASKEVEVKIERGESKGSTPVNYDSDLSITSIEVLLGPKNIKFQLDSSVEVKDIFFIKSTPVEYKVVDIGENYITVLVKPEEVTKFMDTCIGAMICLSRAPMIQIDDNTINILDRTEKETVVNDNAHTIIGVVNESEINSLLECPEELELEEVDVGIYSDNFIGLNSRLYDSIFKKRCDYPKYDESIEIPKDVKDEKYDLAIPNIAWIKELLKLAVPSGTIAMFNGGSDIPEGWAICDGTNGTPNLVGKFIKAVGSVDQIGQDSSELNSENELTLTKDHLPSHNHPHLPHTHDISAGTGVTDESGSLTSWFTYLAPSSSSASVVTSVKDGTTSSISTASSTWTTGSASGGNHTHTFSLPEMTISEETSLEDLIEWENKPVKVEPHSYSLVFIMKL